MDPRTVHFYAAHAADLVRRYIAAGIDATHEMLREAKTNYPTLSPRLTCNTLPNLASVPDAAYDNPLVGV